MGPVYCLYFVLLNDDYCLDLIVLILNNNSGKSVNNDPIL